MDDAKGKGTVCVTGGTGYVASWLIMSLLQKGYNVRATVRPDPEHKKDISFLTNLPGASERLRIFEADLNQPESFNEAIEGCIGVFHLAHPMEIDSQKPEEVMTRRSVEGLLGILRASLSSKTVKRVVYTSSLAAVMHKYECPSVVDESTWSDVDFCRNFVEIIHPAYSISKTITERTALEFAEKHGLEVVSVVLPLVVGPFICSTLPVSVTRTLAMIFGKQDQYKYLFSYAYVVHVDDVANAHIFVFELPNAKGRYFCTSAELTTEEAYVFFSTKYPEIELPTMDLIKEKEIKAPIKSTISSKKLLDTGYKFQHVVNEMLNGAIQSCKGKGFL